MLVFAIASAVLPLAHALRYNGNKGLSDNAGAGQVLERVSQDEIKGYAFDWDDNILFMPSRIHMVKDGKPISFSTEEYAKHRHDKTLKPPDGDFNKAYREFRDDDDPDIFAKTAKQAALDGKFAPSFDTWKSQLIDGSPWSVITARGHSSESLRKGAKAVIEQILSPEEKSKMKTRLQERWSGNHSAPRFNDKLNMSEVLDRYLGHYCTFNGVGGEDFKKKMAEWQKSDVPKEHQLDPSKPEEGKKLALFHFTELVVKIGQPCAGCDSLVQVGFSDDDPKNVEAIEEYMSSTLTKDFPTVSFTLFSTAKGSLEKVKSFPRLRTESPTQTPTQEPTEEPTQSPTQTPTESPTETPTEALTEAPTEEQSLQSSSFQLTFGVLKLSVLGFLIEAFTRM